MSKLYGCCVAVYFLVFASSHAAESVGDVDLTMTGTASYGCNLKTTSLRFDFTLLSVGVPTTKASALDIDCHGAPLSVDFGVTWADQGAMVGGTYTFSDNNDSVLAQFCYAGRSDKCWDSPTYFGAGSLPVDLRLTYSPAAAGSKVRTGRLLVSYH